MIGGEDKEGREGKEEGGDGERGRRGRNINLRFLEISILNS